MAFRKKYEKVMHFDPHLLVIQECEDIDKFKTLDIYSRCNQFIWHGDNKHKGIAILSFHDCNIQLDSSYQESFKYVIPIKIQGPLTFTLFAIWAMPHPTDRQQSYIGQIWKAIKYYQEIQLGDSVWVGDFNSHVKWDKERKIGNHSQVNTALNKQEIYSIYHRLNSCLQGAEKNPTFYLTKNIEKDYHLDYCYASKTFLGLESSIEIGKAEKYLKYSDHMPLFIKLDSQRL